MLVSRSLALGVLFASTSCREPDLIPTARQATDSPKQATSATVVTEPADVQILSDVSVPGLRVRSGTIARSMLWGFSDLTLDLNQVRLEIAAAKGGAVLSKLPPPRALAVVNGGYFEVDFKPSAWLKSAGVELAPKAATSKGGVLALVASNFYVGPLSGLRFNPELAVQSFPLIVEANGASGINRDDGKRAARTVVCIVSGMLHFVLIAAPRGEGPTLFESAELLRSPPPHGFGCRSALNLDGGPSTGVWFSPSVAAKQRLPLAPIAYGIAILPR